MSIIGVPPAARDSARAAGRCSRGDSLAAGHSRSPACLRQRVGRRQRERWPAAAQPRRHARPHGTAEPLAQRGWPDLSLIAHARPVEAGHPGSPAAIKGCLPGRASA